LNAKKNILILCDWFLPGYLAGGPIQSIATLTKQLGHTINFKIITTDRDFKSTEAYKNIKVNEWTYFEGRAVFYVSPENMNPEFLLKLIQDTAHDSIYLNSLFSKHFAVNPLKWKLQGKINSGIILAPRGMLGDGALAIKAFKKQLFLIYAKAFGLFKCVCWQSTSAQETSEIKKRIGRNVSYVEVSNLPNSCSEVSFLEKKTGELKLCFISRISQKKNLNFAIDVLKDITVGNVVFDVYGPVEDEVYWGTCKENAKSLPDSITFNYHGILTPAQIGSTMSEYHALFLPTHNENYGHIIVEALQHGRPVILSDQTPWRNLKQAHVGFDIGLNEKQQFTKAVNDMMQYTQTDFDKTSSSCIAYINQKLNLEDIKQKYLKLFAS
jgi:glycosyltransferase involved in cell wall biosynthesis